MKTNILNYIAENAKTIQFFDLQKYQIVVTFYKDLYLVSYMHKLLDREPRHKAFINENEAINEAKRIFNIVSK